MIASESISVIIPVSNAGDYFERCLSSVITDLGAGDTIIVVIDGEQPELRVRVEQLGVQSITLTQPQGAAAARNRGAEMARGAFFFFVDGDVSIPPGTIDAVRSAFIQHPELAALFGSYDDQPAARNFLSQYKNLSHHFTHQHARAEASTFWTGCGAIRREAFFAVDGFEAGLHGIEDIDLGYRLRRAGYRIRLVKSLQVKHWKHYTLRSLIHSDIFGRALPWTILLLRYRGFTNDLNLDTTNRLSVIVVFLTITLAMIMPFLPIAGAFAMAGLIVFIALNRVQLAFFGQKRGFLFVIRAIPCLMLYYGYGGLAFITASVYDALTHRIPSFPYIAWIEGRR